LLEQFFDRAGYYAAVGYEKAMTKNMVAPPKPGVGLSGQSRSAETAEEKGHVVGR
jgi:hypothetical protein